MKFEDLKNEESIRLWLTGMNAKENTRSSYLAAMSMYTEMFGKSPTELLEEAEREQSGANSVIMRKRQINLHIAEFRAQLEASNVSPYTVHTRLKAVSSFYKRNYIILPLPPKLENKVRPLPENTRIPTKEEIQTALEIADPLEKAIILVECSCGLAVADICRLKISAFRNGHDPEDNITTLRLQRVKTGFNFITFLTPEASQAVLSYLEFRNKQVDKNKKRIPCQKKQCVISDSGYLFIRRNVPNEFLKSGNEESRMLDELSIITMYERLAEDARMSTIKGKWNFLRSHNMRKWFNNRLIDAGCDLETKEFFMGHESSESRSHYYVPDVLSLK
jgi:integrase